MQAASRRRLLLTGASAALVMAAPFTIRVSRAAQPLTPTPRQSEGPFYPVTLPADHDADLLRSGSLDYRRGQVAWVEGAVVDLDGQPVSGAVVEIWQCDEDGRYHHPADRGQADPAFQGFGRVEVGRDGAYRFRTIRPARYSGRTPHIHFKVRLGVHDLLTTQLYVQGDPGNERDFLWRRLSDSGRQALTVPFVPDGSAVRARFPIVVEA